MRSYQNNNLLKYNGEVYLLKDFLETSKFHLEYIISHVQWRNDKIKMFGKFFDQSRRVAWHGDEGISYTYSKIKMISPGWTKELYEIKDLIDKRLDIKANSVLVNLYRNGHDYMSWHRDNEPELGENPEIVSISIGAERDFCFKHIVTKDKKVIVLGNGDALVMRGDTQKHWLHSLPKRKKVLEPRLNLTFRFIQPY